MLLAPSKVAPGKRERDHEERKDKVPFKSGVNEMIGDSAIILLIIPKSIMNDT